MGYKPMVCSVCHDVFQRNSPRQKYCKLCAGKKKAEHQNKYRQKNLEKLKLKSQEYYKRERDKITTRNLRYRNTEKGHEVLRRASEKYRKSEKGRKREKERRKNKSDKYREGERKRQKKYKKSEKGQAAERRYLNTDRVRKLRCAATRKCQLRKMELDTGLDILNILMTIGEKQK